MCTVCSGCENVLSVWMPSVWQWAHVCECATRLEELSVNARVEGEAAARAGPAPEKPHQGISRSSRRLPLCTNISITLLPFPCVLIRSVDCWIISLTERSVL